MTSCLLVYIVLKLGSGGWTTLTETVAEGLLSIFLKKNHLDRVVGFRDTMVRQLAELGPFILGESATQWEARPMTWRALGRMAAEPGEGRQYGQSLGVCSPSEVLSGGPLCCHFTVPHSDPQTKGKLCSLIFHCGNKMPGTWKKEDLFWLMISEASWGQVPVGLHWGRVSQGGGRSRTDCIMVPKN